MLRLLLALAVFQVTGCSGEADGAPPVQVAADRTTTIEHVDGPGAVALLAQVGDVTVLDIRTVEEFEAGHISGALHVDFLADDFAECLEELDKELTYLVHCASGGRSTRALELFESANFARVVHLDGGIQAWESAGQPVE